MFIGDTHFSKHRRGMGIIPVSRWHLSIWPTGCIGRGGARPWIVGSCWSQVLAAKELYKGKEVGIFFNAIVGRPRWCEKSFKASKKCFFVVVVLLIKRVLDKSWVMHLKNSFWQIQMLSEGYSGYSGYSYVSSCIENGILSLVRCTCVRFTGRVAEGKHSADSCGRSTCRRLSLIKRVVLITDRATTPRRRWKRLFEALRGNMVWPFSRFPKTMVL